MILSDKQALRKCIKQVIRQSETIDTVLFNPLTDDIGLEPMLKSIPGGERLRAGTGETPISDRAAEMYAAFNALGIPLNSFEEAGTQQKLYARETWIREILDVMPARNVLTVVPMNAPSTPANMDNRFVPLLRVEEEQVSIGRYGLNLEAEAGNIFETSVRLGTRQILLNGFREDFLHYCLLPLAEDHHLILHLCLDKGRELARLLQLMSGFPQAHCVIYMPDTAEEELISAAQERQRIYPVIRSLRNMEAAVSALGFRFHPLAGFSALPEQMLGRWIRIRDQLSDLMTEQYVKLARPGYELTSEAIEKDLSGFLCNNLQDFCGIE
jgi:hypothetical protein